MKTTTYLRLSLLIPFVVWGLCLLLFTSANPSAASGPLVWRVIVILGLFYLFGIIGWLLPYLLLAAILLILSFTVRTQALIKVLAASPLVMAVLIVAFVIVILGDSLSPGTPAPELAAVGGEFWGSPVWFAIVTLAWGYICVAIGFSLYRVLQALHIIRDTETPPAPIATETA